MRYMYTKYEGYKEADLLADDYFVESMLNPTPDSENFWQLLIAENRIDVNEFIAAYMTIKYVRDHTPAVPTERIDVIWKRIEKTNRKKKWLFSFVTYRYIGIACSVTVIAVLSYFIFRNNDPGVSLVDYAHEYVANLKQQDSEIQLVEGEKVLSLNGVEANVEYDKNGKVKVDKKTVAIRPVQTDGTKGSASGEYSQLHVPYGKRAFLKLADGTSLWINSGSTVIYPAKFEKRQREIYVEGEVFADVYHDATRPFVVKTDRVDIQVLGTTFNVTAYKEDAETNIVLVKGAINVKPQNGGTAAVRPNQIFTYSNRGCTLKEVNVENYISWREGMYVFHNEPIENILLRLSRYYNVTVIFPASASGITCSGKLELKDDMNELLEGLSEITSMNYSMKDNECKVSFSRR